MKTLDMLAIFPSASIVSAHREAVVKFFSVQWQRYDFQSQMDNFPCSGSFSTVLLIYTCQG